MAAGTINKPGFLKDDVDSLHFSNLKKLVGELMETLPASRHFFTKLKAFLFPLIYLGIYSLALIQKQYFLFCLCYLFLGLMLVIMFINLIHEACHGILFRNKKMNRYYLFLLDLMGGNSYMWKKRHINLHHNYINVEDWDSDIEKSKFLKIHPHDQTKLLNRYQHWLILLYPMFVINWFLVRDFKDFFIRKMMVRKLGEVYISEYIKLFAFKLFFIFYMIIFPFLITSFSVGEVIIAFVLMLFIAGLFALFVLLPPHVNTTNQFPVVDENLKLEQSWLQHQLNTTNDVDNTNWFTRNIMANFNFHIAHHLFPNISYVYSREITHVIKDYANRCGLVYRSYPLSTTLKKHYELIRKNQVLPDLLEDDM